MKQSLNLTTQPHEAASGELMDEIQEKVQACIQCEELKECDKDLWKRFPQFHESIVKLQEQYQA